jgi:formate dehydrogenase subunit delta
MQEVDQLAKMANQIADNFSFHDDTADRTADHLKRFWAPSMLKKLMDFEQSGKAELKPEVSEALQTLVSG